MVEIRYDVITDRDKYEKNYEEDDEGRESDHDGSN